MTDPTPTPNLTATLTATLMGVVGRDELLLTAQRALAEADRARVRAETSERRFHSLADVLPQLIWACDPDGTATYFNRRWMEFPKLLLPRERCSDWVDALHPDDRPHIEGAWRCCLDDQAPLEVEARLRTRLGVDRWHLIRATPTVGPNGSHLGWTGTCTDVDDQHRVQEALIRTGEFREQLIGIIGHDLRAPLSAIAITAIKLKAHASQTNSVDLARIHRSAARMGRMIEQLLDFTRGRIGGGIPIHPTTGSVRDVCQNVVAEFEAAQPERLFRLHVADDIVASFDPDRVAQVLSNLVANAIQHGTKATPVDIVVRALDGGWSLSVLSQGNPIPKGEQDVLFEPFRRSRTPVDGHVPTGLGLGLYIVDQAVRAHGGTMSVTSSAHHGTRFTATFPVRLHDPVAAPSGASDPIGVGAPTGALQCDPVSATDVLIIDDGADAAEVLVTLLTRQGHTVALAGTGATGLEQARRMQPKIVVCDIGLPDMTGYDVGRALRADPNTARAFLIALTGFSRKEAEARAVAAGFNALLTKPVDLDELESWLQKGERFHAAQVSP